MLDKQGSSPSSAPTQAGRRARGAWADFLPRNAGLLSNLLGNTITFMTMLMQYTLMSTSKIIGRDGRLIWDNFPVSLKYWMMEWTKPDDGNESWHGKAIVSQTDLRAMIEVQAKSRPIPINELIRTEFPMESHINRRVHSSGSFFLIARESKL